MKKFKCITIALVCGFVLCADSTPMALEEQCIEEEFEIVSLEKLCTGPLEVIRLEPALSTSAYEVTVEEKETEVLTASATEMTEIETEEASEIVIETEEVVIVETESQEQESEVNESEEEIVVISSVDSSDLRYMAAIIYAEAGNQCEAGQQAVGIIVMNRSESSEFANGIYNVIYQKGQFTPASNGSFSKALGLYDSGSIPDSCIEAARYALEGNKTIYYNGITYNLNGYYYFSRYLNNARLVVQDHMFK